MIVCTKLRSLIKASRIREASLNHDPVRSTFKRDKEERRGFEGAPFRDASKGTSHDDRFSPRMSRNILSALVVAHLLMMPLIVHGKVATLPRLVRALWALEGRRFASALYHLVTAHRALPAITLAAETTAEFTLLLVRHTRHVDDAEVVRLRQHLE